MYFVINLRTYVCYFRTYGSFSIIHFHVHIRYCETKPVNIVTATVTFSSAIQTFTSISLISCKCELEGCMTFIVAFSSNVYFTSLLCNCRYTRASH